ncbi:MAG: nucleotidyltransferase domain-containing protein [Candidatus Caldarchaeum sp.]|nr:nucleotidyltransferase domain-containing protein [Candidatus Caldarchaeum sp.]
MGKAASALTSQQRLLESLKSFIADVKRVCAEKGLVFRAAYLVGSRARGDYVEESDADVVVVVDDVGKMNRIQRMLLLVEVLIPENGRGMTWFG